MDKPQREELLMQCEDNNLRSPAAELKQGDRGQK